MYAHPSACRAFCISLPVLLEHSYRQYGCKHQLVPVILNRLLSSGVVGLADVHTDDVYHDPARDKPLRLAGDQNGLPLDDTLQGQNGGDWLYGMRGDDTLVGGLGDDRLYGGSNADFLRSQTGDDQLWGGNGDDRLNSGDNDDGLYGGIGSDTLNGNIGTDTLVGGKDADVFDFDAAGDSGLGKARDVIRHFQDGEGDKIDLSGVDANVDLSGNQAFTFIDDGTFNAAGQLRFAADLHVLYGNTDADATPEFSIQLSGVTSLNAAAVFL
ncbi:MAG: calcium-binding protein [Methylococcaceae bacterium]|nr:MAG: calcium-binding protein [Methylococcaceae bacterium]